MTGFVLATVLPSFLVGLWAGIAWWLWTRPCNTGKAPDEPRSSLHPARVAGLAGACLVAVLLSAPSLWLAALSGYRGDSFFTLEPAERAGLAILSGVLVLAVCWMSAAKSALLHRLMAAAAWSPALTAAADVLVTVALLAALLGVSPQIYYTYDLIIIPGLTAQWVVGDWFDLSMLWRAAALAPDAGLADHLTGITFWVLMLMALCWPLLRRRQGSRLSTPSPLAIGLAAALLCTGVHSLVAWRA